MGIFKKNKIYYTKSESTEQLWNSLDPSERQELCERANIDKKYCKKNFDELPSKIQYRMTLVQNVESMQESTKEESVLKCSICKKNFDRINLWKVKDHPGAYICRDCRYLEREQKKVKQKSQFAGFRARSDYVPEDWENIKKNPNRISDDEFERIIEEFEEGGWSETRNWREYKHHADYINFLFAQEFRNRRGARPRDERKQQTIYIKGDIKTLYDVLEIDKTATSRKIKESYRKLAKKWHPDKNKEEPILAHRMFIMIKDAYETLKDPKKRRQYDESIG